MKKHRLYISGFIFIVIAALAVIFYGPGDVGALNPSHGTCAICHSLHTAPGQSLTNEAAVEVLCLSCHGPAGTADKKAEVHTNKSGSSYPAFTMNCLDCHNPHDNMGNRVGGTNLSQVGKKLDGTGYAMIPTPNSGNSYVVFENRGTNADPPYDSSLRSFADGDEDGDNAFEGVCEVCHTQVSHHRNYDDGDPSHDHTHFVGQNCIICHPHDANFNYSGGGSCDACHSAIFNTEFAQTSHHLGGAPVTEADCAVCHQEPGSSHMDGNIDLKDPDTGSALSMTIPTGATRDTAILPASDTWDVVQLQNNFCFKCHDSDGAQSVATPSTPFSSGNPVPNIYDQFAPTNSYHHAVRGSVNNSYCNATTLVYSWQAGNTITCFDCHETTGHGSANQRMLRTSVDFDSMMAGSPSSTIAGQVQTFCILCHRTAVYISGSAGSRFTSHNIMKHVSTTDNVLGCMGCHAGVLNETGIPDNGSAPGNIHGGNFQWPAQSPTSGTIPDHFILGGYINGWVDGGCYGGNCNHTSKAKAY